MHKIELKDESFSLLHVALYHNDTIIFFLGSHVIIAVIESVSVSPTQTYCLSPCCYLHCNSDVYVLLNHSLGS